VGRWLHYECENITPEEETKLDDPGTNYVCILCTYQHDTMTGKEGANLDLALESSLPFPSFLCSALYQFVRVDIVVLVELLC
jgi:hypothetical protein